MARYVNKIDYLCPSNNVEGFSHKKWKGLSLHTPMTMDSMQLTDIKQGTPGITPIEGANLYENCVVALHHSHHPSPVTLQVSGTTNCAYSLQWEDAFDDQMCRTYADEQSVTERAAVAVSVLLALRQTDYTVVERSRKGTGFDYMLGDSHDPLFTPKARLEVSGIMRQTDSNTPEMRFRQKVAQTAKSDDTRLPAYISIVEFSAPKAIFDIQKK